MKRYLTLMLVLILMLMMVGCSKTVEQQIAEQLELGQKYLEELNYEEAIVAFQRAIDLDPKTWAAYDGISEAYEAQDNYEKAISILESGMQQIAIEEIPSEDINRLVGFYKISAEQTEKQGDQDKLLKFYNKILELRPDDAETIEKLEKRQSEERKREQENTEQKEEEQGKEKLLEESRSSHGINDGDELTERMSLVAEGNEIVFIYWQDQGTFLLQIQPAYKGGACTRYAIVDKNHNVILNAYGDIDGADVWRTTTGYVRLAYCEPGETEMGNDSFTIESIAQNFIPGDVYAELYDWEGNFVERTLLDNDDSYYLQGKELYELYPSTGIYLEQPENYDNGIGNIEDVLDIEQLEDGFLIRDKFGEELGKVHVDEPEQMKIIYKNNLLRIWKEEDYTRFGGSYRSGRFYWLDLE